LAHQQGIILQETLENTKKIPNRSALSEICHKWLKNGEVQKEKIPRIEGRQYLLPIIHTNLTAIIEQEEAYRKERKQKEQNKYQKN